MAELKMIVYTLLLLAVYITATNSSRRMYPPSRHRRERGTTNSSIGTRRRHNREFSTTSSSMRTSRHHVRTGLIVYQGLHKKDKSNSSLFDGDWVKGCPSVCSCQVIQDPSSFYPMLMLVVQDCTSDPTAELSELFSSHSSYKSLMLNNSNMSSLPQEILILQKLKKLHLVKNEFAELPSQLQHLPMLQYLYIQDNKAEQVNIDNITQLSNLSLLELSQSNISALPDGMENMRGLIHLNVSYNKLSSLPEGIWTLTKLQDLDLSYNKLETLPHGIGNLTNLLNLYLLHNKIKTVPSDIGNLTGLQILCLADNRIQTIPNEIREFKNLSKLQVGGNLLKEVPSVPKEHLNILSLSQNRIQTIYCKLLTDSHLTTLDISHNKLTIFDCWGSYGVGLTHLNLSHNALNDTPCVSTGWDNLKVLDMSNNKFSSIEHCQLFSQSKISELYLSSNEIINLNFQNFCYEAFLGSYRILDLSNSKITTIKGVIPYLGKCFSKAAVIDLANNRLSTLDSWPLLLAKRESITLDVSGNNLSDFTNSAGTSLPTIKYGTVFKMQRNRISHFMDIFNGWKMIVNTTENVNTLLKNVYFDLAGNPLICDCVDYEVYRYAQTLSSEQYKNLTCHLPKLLRGHSPHQIPLWNFVCGVNVKCPKGCICVQVPHSQSINITCGSYVQTDLPETVPDLPTKKYTYRLDICHRHLTNITFRSYLQNATQIILSNNSIFDIKISSSTVFQRLRILHLDNNLLQRLPDSVVGMTNDTAVEIKLGSNPWLCNCEAMAMKNWILKNWHIVKDKDNIHCHSPITMFGKKVKDIERSQVCANENLTAVYVVGVISSVVLSYIVYLNFCNRAKVRSGPDECYGEHKVFDIFVCSASDVEDSEYVENYLIPELERRDFRVLYHREHFHPGKPIHVNMSEAIEKSKRTLVFFSNNFQTSGFGMFEFHTAHHLDIQNKTRRLITIKDTDLDLSRLEISEVHYFKMHTYLAREDVNFWKLLEGVLPKKRLGAQVR